MPLRAVFFRRYIYRSLIASIRSLHGSCVCACIHLIGSRRSRQPRRLECSAFFLAVMCLSRFTTTSNLPVPYEREPASQALPSHPRSLLAGQGSPLERPFALRTPTRRESQPRSDRLPTPASRQCHAAEPPLPDVKSGAHIGQRCASHRLSLSVAPPTHASGSAACVAIRPVLPYSR